MFLLCYHFFSMDSSFHHSLLWGAKRLRNPSRSFGRRLCSLHNPVAMFNISLTVWKEPLGYLQSSIAIGDSVSESFNNSRSRSLVRVVSQFNALWRLHNGCRPKKMDAYFVLVSNDEIFSRDLTLYWFAISTFTNDNKYWQGYVFRAEVIISIHHCSLIARNFGKLLF
jgi:hypothetical protein